MKKELTREEVEKALCKRLLLEHDRQAILNDLFGKPFGFEKNGWITITKSETNWNKKMDDFVGKTVQITNTHNDDFVSFLNSGNWTWSYSCGHFRHATPEEIAEATWEEGKPYRVYWNNEWWIRVSAKRVGSFYNGGKFNGSVSEYFKYEKL